MNYTHLRQDSLFTRALMFGKDREAMESKKILVVDDEERVRITLVELLCLFGYEVEAVASGEEALAVFDEAKHVLVVTDYSMPGMQGVELIRALRRRCPELPIIALTGAGAEAERELLAAGAHECLKKPSGIGRMKEVVERVLKE